MTGLPILSSFSALPRDPRLCVALTPYGFVAGRASCLQCQSKPIAYSPDPACRGLAQRLRRGQAYVERLNAHYFGGRCCPLAAWDQQRFRFCDTAAMAISSGWLTPACCWKAPATRSRELQVWFYRWWLFSYDESVHFTGCRVIIKTLCWEFCHTCMPVHPSIRGSARN